MYVCIYIYIYIYVQYIYIYIYIYIYRHRHRHRHVMHMQPGGRLVFSTCTMSVSENEQNVAWALSKFPLRLLEPSPRVGEPGLPGAGLSEEDRHKVQRFGPVSSTVPLRFTYH